MLVMMAIETRRIGFEDARELSASPRVATTAYRHAQDADIFLGSHLGCI
jgi:hypothetical protein